MVDLQSAWGMRPAAGGALPSRVFTVETVGDAAREPKRPSRRKPVDDLGESFALDDGRRKSVAELAAICGFKRVSSKERASLSFEGQLWG